MMRLCPIWSVSWLALSERENWEGYRYEVTFRRHSEASRFARNLRATRGTGIVLGVYRGNRLYGLRHYRRFGGASESLKRVHGRQTREWGPEFYPPPAPPPEQKQIQRADTDTESC